jgi:hypothetical protein
VSGDDEARTTAKFLRGLTIGAIVGAVIAGSSLLARRGRRPEKRPDVPVRDPERPTPR